MQSSFFSDKKRIVLVTFIVVILVGVGIAIILLPFYDELNVSFTIKSLAIKDGSMELTVEVANPGFQAKFVDFNLTSQNTNPLLFGNTKTNVAGGSAETLTILFDLPNPIMLPETFVFQLDALIQNRTIIHHSLNAPYNSPDFGSNSWMIKRTSLYTQKGDPWVIQLWLDLSKENFSSAVIHPTYQVRPFQDFIDSLAWPELLIGYNPLQKNVTLPIFDNSNGYTLIQLHLGPFFYDTNQSSYYAFNIMKSSREATYHLDKLMLSISQDSSVILNQTNIYLSGGYETLYLRQDNNKHSMLSAMLVDDSFYDEYGEPQNFLHGLEEEFLTYNNESYSVKDLLNITFPVLPLKWTVPDPVSVWGMLSDLPIIMNASLNLSQEWYRVKGTYWKHHGFDLAAGSTGKQNKDARVAGMSFLNSNLLVIAGGWFESTFVQRSFDLGTMRRAFLHEFLHTLSAVHVDEPFYLMSPGLGGWLFHPQTYQVVVGNIDQYTGLYFES
ncbi:MAG: hypothetical protein ACFFDI_21940 [Promethearchaeota archaeon]